MSFITKRERVFNEYDLFDLPARNEGKLKAYASCTDARAWSHFCSDKSEHLVEIIKRNNETCRPKYVPTDVIVDTLMVAKNAEISRLKRKIEEFEQMLAAYDQLELTCEQKCEIANAHAAIKAANKELDELCLDLDLSGFTEGVDSEAFETGKSRGDEASKYTIADETPRSKGEETPKSKGDEEFLQQWSYEKEPARIPKMETKSNQMGLLCPCDASTSARDARIEEMQEIIITKDAKLNAMQNTIAVMENDVCEPYCIYAHIYTALEKIFAILCQNAKYKQYLELMTVGKDTRCIDIKGKILFKMKVLEKFSVALIAPCSQELGTSPKECSCYRAEIVPHIETTYALTSAESKQPNLDNKRAQLVADIMDNEEMKEILSKESTFDKTDLDQIDDSIILDDYNIDTENLKRLKILQENYDDLMTCYESLKHEKDCLQIRCLKYEELEKELETLRGQLREYNLLWNEKEHYRRRSSDLDSLKEQYMILSAEASNYEIQIKAESDINKIKTITIDDLRSENITLDKKITETSIAFEKERNSLQCKLKEYECKVMCQEQQIKNLLAQIDRLLEQDHDKAQPLESDPRSITLIDEIESRKEQIKTLKDSLFCAEEEKQQIQEEFQNKLKVINELRMEIEDWKSTCEKTLQRNEYLEKYTESFLDEVHRLKEENRTLSQDVEEKAVALGNLMNVIKNKSQEVDNLMDEIERINSENNNLLDKLHNLQEIQNSAIITLDNEKTQALSSLELARQESQELLEKVKDYDELINKQVDLSEDYQRLKTILIEAQEENQNLRLDLASRENNNSILLQEIQRLREVNNYALNNINTLKDEKNQYKHSLDLNKKESEILEVKLSQYEDLSHQLQKLRESHEKLIAENTKLEIKLHDKSFELDNAIHTIHLTKKGSEELVDKLQQSENIQTDFIELNRAYQKLINEKSILQEDLSDKKRDLGNLLESFNELKLQNEYLNEKSKHFDNLSKKLSDLEISYNELLAEKKNLQKDFNNKTEEISNLYNTLESTKEENKELSAKVKSLELGQTTAIKTIKDLENENVSTNQTLRAITKESAELIDKIKYYETLEAKFNELKRTHEEMITEKDTLRKEFNRQMSNFNRIQQENNTLNSQSQHILSHNEDLEKALINARTELMTKSNCSFEQDSHSIILQEIEDMKKEKSTNLRKIRDLLDKLDKSENIISNLSEDVLARDDRIAILENHINELEDEVRRLHQTLAEVVDTGEQINDNSHQKIDQSLKKMEAHHSKAAHNMKMELAKLQNDKIKLEEQLSASKLKTEESSTNKHKYVSQIINLQNEREIIFTNIKQLELKSIGDSALSSDTCNLEDVLESLDRIKKYLDSVSSKNTSLEQTLNNVQTSYKLVQSKADEAKKIVEKEKQKNINEKEEAIKDRLIMENQLIESKEKLENQISHYINVIKDLEAEILNQKLIIDKIKISKQTYISKLEEKIQSLEELYHNSTMKITELQEKMHNMLKDNDNKSDIIEKIKRELQAKSKEIEILQNILEEVKKKPKHNVAVQVVAAGEHRNIETQTEKGPQYEGLENFDQSNNKTIETKQKMKMQEQKLMDNKHALESKPLNEIQVLTANVQSTFDYLKDSYVNYKMKQLSPGRLEQYSISCMTNTIDLSNTNEYSPMASDDLFEQPLNIVSDNSAKTYAAVTSENKNVIDIYNRQSMQTNTTKVTANEDVEDSIDFRLGPRSPMKSSATEFGLTNESFEIERHNDNKQHSNIFIESTSDNSADKDLFVIYRDSITNNAKIPQDDKGRWSINPNSETLVNSLAVYPNKISKKIIKKIKKERKIKKILKEKNQVNHAEDNESNKIKDDSVKKKLNISLPRIETKGPSVLTTSEGDKESLDSYTLAIYSSPKPSTENFYNDHTANIKNVNQETTLFTHENQCLGSYDSSATVSVGVHLKELVEKSNLDVKSKVAKQIISSSTEEPIIIEKRHKLKTMTSHHKLSRVGADVLLFNTSTKSQNSRNVGLDYILDAVQNKVDPESIKTYNVVKALRKARSDERFNQAKSDDSSDPSSLSACKIPSAVLENISSFTPSKSTNKSRRPSCVERSVMVKMDPVDEYENKINYLTKTLENIEKDYKKKIEAIKMQYDSNIKSIINEHNQGVKSIQNLHEETLQDIKKIHENEVENLRSMSIEAMRKADKLNKENWTLKNKIQICSCTGLDEEPIKISTPEVKRRKKCRGDTKTLTKTNVEAFNVKPKSRSHGPCTCSLDVNISDTIRNIFEQVDVEQRKMAEYTYLKYISNKILNGSVEGLDAQELSFLHFKVCRAWKTKLSKEESLQKRIDSLESELINKQKHTQQHIAELDRKVAEERQRLQEVREAVCRNTPTGAKAGIQSAGGHCALPPPPPPTADHELVCRYNTEPRNLDIGERRSAGDLIPALSPAGLRPRRARTENNRAVLAKLVVEERRDKKVYNDEPPTRLRRSHDRQTLRLSKK